MLARRSTELRAEGDSLIKQADKLLCESWNERMWADGDGALKIVAMGEKEGPAPVA